MAFTYSITTTVTTASANDCLRLFHGTLAGHVSSLKRGIDFTRRADGTFWATPDLEDARYYAGIAEQQRLFVGGLPGQAILAFDIPIGVIEEFQGQTPDPWLMAHAQGFRFSQACSPVLNAEMKNIEITFEE